MREFLAKLVASDKSHLRTALFLLRLFAGGMMLLAHGWSKWTSFGQLQAVFPDPLGVGPELSLGLILFAEIFCSVLVIFGLLTRLAVLPLMFGMIVAFFGVHGGQPFAARELPLLYFGMYGILLWGGAGRYAVDEWIRQKLSRREPSR